MNLLSELSEVVIATLILAIGLGAIALVALRSAGRDPAALWFGLFGCLYGLRLAGQSALVQVFLSETFWRYVEPFFNYLIIVPGALFAAALLGQDRPALMRRVWQALLALALLSMAIDLAQGRPGGMQWLNRCVVIALGSFVMARMIILRRRAPWPRELHVAFACGLLFLCVAVYQTLGGRLQVEHYAMLAFMTSTGAAVAWRLLATERRLAEVSQEMRIAREIQLSILPRALPACRGLLVGARYLPAGDVGGDVYDVAAPRAECLSLILADVTGHGVPAALLASMVKTGFETESARHAEPGLVLRNLNRLLCDRFEGTFVTACCACLDARARTIRYASAGHPPALLRRQEGRVERLDEGGLLLAFDPDAQYLTGEAELRGGDRLLFYSDGVTEASDAGEREFGVTRLEQLLAADQPGGPEAFIDSLMDELRRWTGLQAAFQDDVTALVVDVVPHLPDAADSPA